MEIATASGWTFRADEEGPDGGPPVLLLHGFPQTLRCWAATLPVLAAAGYPESPRRGDPIVGLDRVRDAGALVFHGGTTADGADGYRTDGGRIVTVVGRGPDLDAARRQAEAAADLIAFDGLQRRHDIGADSVPLGAGR